MIWLMLVKCLIKSVLLKDCNFVEVYPGIAYPRNSGFCPCGNDWQDCTAPRCDCFSSTVFGEELSCHSVDLKRVIYSLDY